MKKRILFVDDSASVLNSLRLSLRGKNAEWDMVFALGGEQALELLGQSQFDLLVTDMRMPGIDGSQLLNAAHREHPSMGRIILSGYAEQDCVLKNISMAHQYLSKPCSTQELVSTIQNALSQGDCLVEGRMREIVSNLQSLPALPTIYRELSEALESSDASWKEIREILGKDMSLVATVMRVANCAFFGLGGSVSSLDHAVKLLGTQTLRTLLLSTHLFSVFDRKTTPIFSVSKLWNHSIRVSGFSRLIAAEENLPAKSRENCFIAGMLHDIGKVVLSVVMPEEFSKVIDTVRHENCTVHEAEIAVLNVTHAEVGAYLMGLWGFSRDQIDAVRLHHLEAYTSTDAHSVSQILHFSNVIDHELVRINPSYSKNNLNNRKSNNITIEDCDKWTNICKIKIENDNQNKIMKILYQ